MRYQSYKTIISKLATVLFVIMILFLSNVKIVYAGEFGITNEFDGLSGNAKYLGSEYRDNYQMDMEKLGMTEAADKAFNAVANVVFSGIHFIGYTASVLFYYAMDFDLAQLLKDQIDAIQSALHDSVFSPMLQIGIVGAIIIAITRFAKRDFIGLVEQFGKVIFIIFLSFMVVKDSSTILSYATGITKSISVSILTGASNGTVDTNVTDFAAEAAGTLWTSLVHNPWLSLEFGNYSYSDEDVEALLSKQTEKERKSLVKSMMDGDDGPFAKGRSAERIGNGVMILLTVTFKSIVYVGVAILQVGFQGLAIFYIMLAPVILILSLFPGYDIQLLAIWTKKILETQVGVLLLTFLMGFMILIDNVMTSLAGTIGWFPVLIIQIVAYAFLFMNRGKILHLMSEAQRGVQMPRRMNTQLKQSGNLFRTAEDIEKNQNRKKTLSNAKRGKDISGPTAPPVNRTNFTRQKDTNNPGRGDSGVQRPILSTSESTVHSSAAVEGTSDNRNTYNQGSVIRGDGYYASYAVTDNWRETWYGTNSKTSPKVMRPKTDDRDNSMHRRQVLSQSAGMDVVNRENINKSPKISYAKVHNPAIQESNGSSVATSIVLELIDRPKTSSRPGQVAGASVAVPEPAKRPRTSSRPGQASGTSVAAPEPADRPRTFSRPGQASGTSVAAPEPADRPKTSSRPGQASGTSVAAPEPAGRPKASSKPGQAAGSSVAAPEPADRPKTPSKPGQTSGSSVAAPELADRPKASFKPGQAAGSSVTTPAPADRPKTSSRPSQAAGSSVAAPEPADRPKTSSEPGQASRSSVTTLVPADRPKTPSRPNQASGSSVVAPAPADHPKVSPSLRTRSGRAETGRTNKI